MSSSRTIQSETVVEIKSKEDIIVRIWFLVVSARYVWDLFKLLRDLSMSGWDLIYFTARWPRIWIVTRFLMIFPLLNLVFSQREKDYSRSPSGRLLTLGTVSVIVLGFGLRVYAATSMHGSVYEVFYAGLHFEGAEMRLDAFRPVLYPFLQYASWIIIDSVYGYGPFPKALTEGTVAGRFPHSWIFASRMLSTVLSTISLGLIWVVARNLFGERAGFWATLLHAVNHYVVTGPDSRAHDENPGTLFLLASVAVLTRKSKMDDKRDGRVFNLFFSGVLSGLSFASRSPMFIFTSSLATFLLWNEGVSSTGYFLLGFVLILFLEGLAEFIIRGVFLGGVFQFLNFNILAGHASDFGTSPWYDYILLVFTVVGLVFYLLPFGIEKDSRSVLLGLLVFPFLAAFSAVSHKEHRYVSPIFPFIHILIGNALSKMDKKRAEVLAAALHTAVYGITMIILW